MIIYKETVNRKILKIVSNKYIFSCPRDKTIKLYDILKNKLILNIKNSRSGYWIRLEQ